MQQVSYLAKQDQALGPTVCHSGCNCCFVYSPITGLHTQIHDHKLKSKVKSNKTVTGWMNVPLLNQAGDDV